MIPEVVHQIWIGSEPPEWVERSWVNWRRILPSGWELRLWRNAEVEAEPGLRRFLAMPDTDPRVKADLLRIHIIGLYGGIYVDVDCLALGDISFLAGDRPSWVAATPRSRGMGRVENSCYGFRPAHPVMAEWAERAEAKILRGIKEVHAISVIPFGQVLREVGDDVEIRSDYKHSAAIELRRALYDSASADLEDLLSRHGPFPIIHVNRPRL